MQIKRPNGRIYRLIDAGITRDRIHMYRCIDIETQQSVGFCVKYKRSSVYGPICNDRYTAIRRAFNVAVAHHCKTK